ncbi:hypothetical protein ARAM_001605 [Aspergillus rambellii]|uniref:Cytochrome P450 n=1 Tax=Aspergillus rambellii TaxID=308745 RepID=A0A0F8WRE8_9EURO|nr:hypothetical protein ARAM_001605 [Aspergillus rambellii]
MLLDYFRILRPTDLAPLVGILLSTLVLYLAFPITRRAKLPLINGKRPGEIWATDAINRFLSDSESLLKEGFEKSENGFYLGTDNGTMLILPMRYATSIRDTNGLSFSLFARDLFHWHIGGLEAFQPNHVVHETVNKKLTRKLESLVDPLSAVTAATLREHWADCSDWSKITLSDSILAIFTKVSSRVFLGEDLYQTPEWIQLLQDYMVDSYVAVGSLRRWPVPFRPLVANFLPSVHKARKLIQGARDIINPVVEERRAAPETTTETCGLDWIDETASALGVPYDPAVAQLGLSLGSVNTGADMVTQLLFDICGQEKLVRDLRQEIIAVLRHEEEEVAAAMSEDSGSRKTSRKALLYKLKLLDSVMKESQRLKPLASVMVTRTAQREVTLPEGIVLPRGSYVGISNYEMRRAGSPMGAEFDGYRYYNLRESTGDETWTQFVSTGPKVMGFGYGQYACPGRFFASDQIKIFMCHLLLKFDFKLPPGEGRPPVYTSGFSLIANPTAQILIRKREAEVDLDAILGL